MWSWSPKCRQELWENIRKIRTAVKEADKSLPTNEIKFKLKEQ